MCVFAQFFPDSSGLNLYDITLVLVTHRTAGDDSEFVIYKSHKLAGPGGGVCIIFRREEAKAAKRTESGPPCHEFLFPWFLFSELSSARKSLTMINEAEGPRFTPQNSSLDISLSICETRQRFVTKLALPLHGVREAFREISWGVLWCAQCKRKTMLLSLSSCLVKVSSFVFFSFFFFAIATLN